MSQSLTYINAELFERFGFPPQFLNCGFKDNPKIPVGTNGRPVNAQDSTNWKPYVEVAAISDRVGFVITANDPFFCIDLDNCLMADGQWAPDVVAIVNQFHGALIEISQSGKGLHVMGVCDKSRLTDRVNKWDGNKEFYISGRFIAFGQEGWSVFGG